MLLNYQQDQKIFNLLDFRNKHRKIKLATQVARVQYIPGVGDYKYLYYDGDKFYLKLRGAYKKIILILVFDIITNKQLIGIRYKSYAFD
jgi:hypothetical protein